MSRSSAAIVMWLLATSSSSSVLAQCDGDLDGDGSTDLVDLALLLPEFGCQSAPGRPCAVDVNADGATDLTDLAILLSNFGCTPCAPGQLFGEAAPISFGELVYMYASTTGDADGDGDTDIAVLGYTSILRNAGDGSFAAIPLSFAFTGGGGEGIVLGDVDGDGDNDLAWTEHNVLKICVAANLGGLNYAPHVEYDMDTRPQMIWLANLDSQNPNEPFPDIVAASESEVTVLWNDTAGGFAERTTIQGIFQSPTIAHVDADGMLDLVWPHGNVTTSSIRVMRRSPVFPRAFFGPESYPVPGRIWHLAVADLALDNNGFYDVAAVLDTDQVAILRGSEGGLGLWRSFAVAGGPYRILAREIEGDADSDLIVATRDDPAVVVLRNNGAGSFAQERYPLAQTPQRIIVADMDGDSDRDLVIPCADNVFAVLRNRGSGLFDVESYDAVLPVEQVRDFNGDGRPDVFLLRTSTGGFAEAAILLNRCH